MLQYGPLIRRPDCPDLNLSMKPHKQLHMEREKGFLHDAVEKSYIQDITVQYKW